MSGEVSEWRGARNQASWLTHTPCIAVRGSGNKPPAWPSWPSWPCWMIPEGRSPALQLLVRPALIAGKLRGQLAGHLQVVVRGHWAHEAQR